MVRTDMPWPLVLGGTREVDEGSGGHHNRRGGRDGARGRRGGRRDGRWSSQGQQYYRPPPYQQQNQSYQQHQQQQYWQQPYQQQQQQNDHDKQQHCKRCGQFGHIADRYMAPTPAFIPQHPGSQAHVSFDGEYAPPAPTPPDPASSDPSAPPDADSPPTVDWALMAHSVSRSSFEGSLDEPRGKGASTDQAVPSRVLAGVHTYASDCCRSNRTSPGCSTA